MRGQVDVKADSNISYNSFVYFFKNPHTQDIRKLEFHHYKQFDVGFEVRNREVPATEVHSFRER